MQPFTPRSGSSPFLEWVDDRGTIRSVEPLKFGNSWVLGRDPGCDFPISSTGVSWHHARLDRNEGGWTISDLGATNGTQLHNEPIPAHVALALFPGDVFYLGNCEIRFCASPSHSPPNGPTALLPIANSSSKTLLMGRAPDCDMPLISPDVSWHHARLTRDGQFWRLEDLGSANGTFVNEVRVERAILKAGDRLQIGPYRLKPGQDSSVEGEEGRRLALEARNLWKVTRAGATLLRDVSLSISSGEMVAIAGASGAGKSTLLKALNGTGRASRGQVLLGELDLYAHGDLFHNAIGYVPQDDIVHSDLTVASALRFAARLRLPGDTGETEIAELVARTLSGLEIAARAHLPIRALSGGERKRVNIAVELLTRPSVLFLDEPTTGLDAGLEQRVTDLLRGLAGEGRTVVVVTHAATTLESYDKVAFLARGGRLAFFGPPRAALQHFGVRDYAQIYEILDGNPPDFAAQSSLPTPVFLSEAARSRTKTSTWGQARTLVERYGAVVRADTRNLLFWALQAPIVALLMALLFESGTFADAQTRNAQGDWPIHGAPRLLFLMAFALVCFGLCNAAREIVKERAIYERERHVALRIGPYLSSKIALLSCVAGLQVAITLAVVALKMPLGLGGSELLIAFVLLFLGALNALLLGLLVSALSSSPDQSITLVAGLLLLQVLFSGLVPLGQLPDWLRPLANLCAVRWSYGGLCGLFDLPARWEAVGLGSWVDIVMKTGVTRALGALSLLAAGSLGATWLALEWKERTRH